MKDDDELMTWRDALAEEREDTGDQSAIVHVAPNEAMLDVKFYGGFGGTDGPAVLIWTEQRVYFPVTYDGAEWLGSAPRNPIDQGQDHVGGG